jgi:hypothetical protein
MGVRNTVGVVALAACICMSVQCRDAKSKNLPPGIFKALAKYEAAYDADYCAQYSGERKKQCHQTYRTNLNWQELVITPSGQTAILVESDNMGFCGAAGCSLYLVIEKPDGNFVQVLGTDGDTGTLGRIKVLKDTTRGYYNIQKTWRDDKSRTLYLWDGLRYSAR